MSNITRRNQAVPVEARRAGAGAEPVVITLAPGEPAPSAPPPGGQNVVYVVTQTPPQMPSGQPAPPQVHYHDHTIHNTTTHNYAPRKPLGKETSFLGMLALVIGAVAGITAFLPPVAVYAKPIAQAGLIAGTLGLLMAMLFRRSGRGLPLFSLLICGAAMLIWLNNTHQLQGKYDQLRSKCPIPLPAIAFDSSNNPTATGPDSTNATPGDSAPRPAANSAQPTHGDQPVVITPVQPAPRDTAPKDHTIFGDGGGKWEPQTK